MKKLSVIPYNIKSRIFQKMFASYILIIVICFSAYTWVVLHEAKTLKQEQMNQYYETKLQEVTNAVDKQIMGAQTLVASINSSQIINQLYIETLTKRSVDPYLIFQVMNDLKSIKAGSNNLNIYNVVVLFNQYNRAYTGGEIIRMEDVFTMTPEIETDSRVTTLNDLIAMKNPQILFNKEFLIYYDDYHYNYGSRRGMVGVLISQETIQFMIDKIVDKNTSWSIYNGENELLTGGSGGELVFSRHSSVDRDYTYEIRVDKEAFNLSYDPIWSVAIFIGFALCIVYIALAYVFSSRYYEPFGRIRSLVGNRENVELMGFKDIVTEVESLVGERNGYKETVMTISPYAQQGILHSILSGNVDSEHLKELCADEVMKLQHMYFMLAAINIGYVGDDVTNGETIKELKRAILHQSRTLSNQDVRFLCYEGDFQTIYLIINSNNGEKIEDLLYGFYETLEQNNTHNDYVFTMGVDDVKEEVFRLYESFKHATIALYGMVTGGRGTVYFYEDKDNASNDYYFPKDAVKTMSKAFREVDRTQINELFMEILEKNTRHYDLSFIAIQSLLDEIYIMTANAVRIINGADQVKIKLEKLQSITTLEEAIGYYLKVCELVLRQTQKEADEAPSQINKAELEIFRYVDENFKNSEISLAQITEKFQVSNKYITYLFKKQFGNTYLQYVQEKRIAYAIELLKAGNDPLEVVAEACGYTNLLTFRRNFKAITGMNPSDYKIGQI